MMRRATFFVLTTPLERDLAICHLIQRYYRQNRQVYVHCDSQSQAEILDQRLWSFDPDSFIPHHLVGEGPSTPPPVQIGTAASGSHRDVMLQAGLVLYPAFNQFREIIECVDLSESVKVALREHYRSLQQARYTVNTHSLNDVTELAGDDTV